LRLNPGFPIRGRDNVPTFTDSDQRTIDTGNIEQHGPGGQWHEFRIFHIQIVIGIASRRPATASQENTKNRLESGKFGHLMQRSLMK
jgi:hypothetical protein